MPDTQFAEPRLASLYDAMEGERTDLDVYAALVEGLGARSVLDVGCGTGTLCCTLAARGLDVIGVDPAAASLEVARAKRGSGAVRFLHGDPATLPPMQVDLAIMTGNVAQVFLTDAGWTQALFGIRAALCPEGRIVFESRDPVQRAWTEWDRGHTYATAQVAGVGPVTHWCDLLEVSGPFVSFRWTFVFETDGAVLTSDSTLRFRGRDEFEESLLDAGYVLEDVRDAPDRPGREMVFVASRGSAAPLA